MVSSEKETTKYLNAFVLKKLLEDLFFEHMDFFETIASLIVTQPDTTIRTLRDVLRHISSTENMDKKPPKSQKDRLVKRIENLEVGLSLRDKLKLTEMVERLSEDQIRSIIEEAARAAETLDNVVLGLEMGY